MLSAQGQHFFFCLLEERVFHFMNKKQVELLAPAGNSCAFYGAVNAGADAIYMGGNRFGARAYADNFLCCKGNQPYRFIKNKHQYA